MMAQKKKNCNKGIALERSVGQQGKRGGGVCVCVCGGGGGGGGGRGRSLVEF